ncbi:unnamed protein product, partial [Closterium sp. NIES-53]
QEDAQEFLTFLTDRLHEELLKVTSQLSHSGTRPGVGAAAGAGGGRGEGEGGEGEGGEEGDPEEWQTVGPKQRAAVTRTHAVQSSCLSEIFGGQLRSEVRSAGSKPSATVQPFSLLQLDIASDRIRSVEEALKAFAAPEVVEGYRPSNAKPNQTVLASKTVKISALPHVLVLHLMRFSFSHSTAGSVKIHKPVSFPLSLTLSRDLLFSSSSSAEVCFLFLPCPALHPFILFLPLSRSTSPSPSLSPSLSHGTSSSPSVEVSTLTLSLSLSLPLEWPLY